jgi:hypothetical protein
MRREHLVDVVRVGVRELRLALPADPQLEEVAEGAIAALASEQRLNRALVDVVLARETRGREGHTAERVAVLGLRHVEAPDSVHRIRSTRTASGGGVDVGARPYPGDVHPSVVACGDPREDVVGEVASRHPDWCRGASRRTRWQERPLLALMHAGG